jgi:hypothetical protein
MNDLAVLVLSYDGAKDLWKPFFDTFFKNWMDCQYRIYLLANEADFVYNKVKVIKSGKRLDWADSVHKIASQIEEEYLFLLLEDYFLLNKVDSSAVQEQFEYLVKNKGDAINLMGIPKGKIKIDGQYRERSWKQPYCITFGCSIMRKDSFMHLCKSGYSPWDFENRNSATAYALKKMPIKFYTVKKKMFPIWSEGIIVKGKFTKKAVKHCLKNKIDIDLKVRSVMTGGQTLKECIRAKVLGLVPARLKAYLKSKKLKNIEVEL